MFETFSRSFKLVKESFSVLRKDKEIMLFPIVSAFVTIGLFFSFLLPLLFVKLFVGGSVLYFVLFFLYYLLSYFIVIFFNTGLVTCANIRLNGGDPTFQDGIKNALKNIGKILLWALISATVGIILRAISSRSRGNFGKIIAAILGMAWSLLTFFVVPVMMVEGKPVFESIKKSTELFKKTWGENVIAQASLGAFFFILFLAGLVPFVLSLFLGSTTLMITMGVLMIVYFVILAVVSSSLNGIFTTALYNYANTGKVPSAYSEELVKKAFA